MIRTLSRHKPHDPHAHVIHSPGKRLLQKIPLDFVWRRASGRGHGGKSASLNLVSFIDFLVVTVIFLLMSFSASGECADRTTKIPGAVNAQSLIDAPMVSVGMNQILVDGVLAGSSRALLEEGRFQKVGPLFDLLKAKRELWMAVQPKKAFPGVCILVIDRDVPAVVVKSVFQTAAYAGYGDVSFMVRKLDR